MRVRWALEEVGQPYEVCLVSFGAMKEPAHLALHPFGQIPTYEEGDLGLIAERHAGLLPDDANARARAITWIFAALNTVEPPILELGTARLLESDKPWSAQHMPLVEDRVRNRLDQLSRRLGDADWLDGAFGAGDLMMVSVLLRLKASGMLDEYPNLSAYMARGEARPAYVRAFEAQLAVNKPPAGWLTSGSKSSFDFFVSHDAATMTEPRSGCAGMVKPARLQTALTDAPRLCLPAFDRKWVDQLHTSHAARDRLRSPQDVLQNRTPCEVSLSHSGQLHRHSARLRRESWLVFQE
jgi:glutathione S-transferase